MEDSTAEGLAGAGALLAAASLALPWYSVGVSGRLADQIPAGTPSLGSQSGWEALGGLHWVVLAFALLAGWTGARRIAPALPLVAAVGLLGVAAYAYLAPPGLGDQLAAQLPESGGGTVGTAFAKVVVTSLADQIGLALEPALGIGAAAVGAVAAVVGGVNRA